jgi:hypothetical protein
MILAPKKRGHASITTLTRFCIRQNGKASAYNDIKAPRIYRSGSGACPCREDTYTTRDGEKHACGEKSAEAKRAWVMCDPKKVPSDLVDKIRVSLPAECWAH